MTYSALLTAIYAEYDKLWGAWTTAMEKAGDIGAFVFLPDRYKAVERLDQLSYAYWTEEAVCAYLRDAGISPEGFESVLEDVSVAEEFLVMIVEDVGDSHARAVHVHRIARLGIN